MPQPRALITGGTGFIGRALVAQLQASGWHVSLLVRPGSRGEGVPASAISIPSGDGVQVCNAWQQLFAQERPNVIFHLATDQQKQHTPAGIDAMLNVNIALGTHLLEAACAFGGVPFINIGSYWQFRGSSETDPVNLYAATKSAFFEIVKYYNAVRGNPIVNLLLVDTYGENDPRDKILDLLIRAAMSGTAVDLSPGEQALEFVHVDDVVAGMICTAEQLLGGQLTSGSFGLATGKTITLRNAAMLVADVVGRQVPVNWGALPYANRQIMDARVPYPQLTGWQPVISLRDGITRLVNHARPGQPHD